jgi:Uma2 family endonuclease
MSTRINPALTVADLAVLPDDGKRYELIEGDLHVSRAPHLVHQLVLSNLLYEIRAYLQNNPVGRIVPEIGVFLSEQDAVIPDLAFVSSDRFDRITSGGKLVEAPDLVVEILSGGSENVRRDRVVKRHLYGKHGVKEYWIVDWESETVELFKLEESGLELSATLAGEDELTSRLLPGFRISVARLFDV